MQMIISNYKQQKQAFQTNIYLKDSTFKTVKINSHLSPHLQMILQTLIRKSNNQVIIMQKYQASKSQLILLITVLFTLLLVCVAILIVQCLDLNTDDDQLADIKNYQFDKNQIPCNTFCQTYTFQVEGACCDMQVNGQCETKQICYNTAVQKAEWEVQKDIYGVTYSAGPALLFLLFLILMSTHFYRLRKAAKEQALWQQQEALLANQENLQEIQYDFEEQSIENYEEFIQFLIDSGYILPGMMVAPPKKRGDPKITDSFVTVDGQFCPICMMQFKEQKVLRLICDHKFHSGCIRDWNKANPTCPVCRADIYPQE